MQSVNQYNVADRLPSHVWLRLRGELHGLVHERAGGRLGWYHRQLKEAAEKRYSGICGGERVALCGIMALYFGNLVSEAVVTKTKVASQPLTLNCSEKDVWLPTAKINKRRCVEAAPHMLTAAMFAEAETELCSLESVCARAKCGKQVNAIILFAASHLTPLTYDRRNIRFGGSVIETVSDPAAAASEYARGSLPAMGS